MAVPPSYCFPFFPDGVGTEDSGAEMSGLYSRLCRGMKISQIAELKTITYTI